MAVGGSTADGFSEKQQRKLRRPKASPSPGTAADSAAAHLPEFDGSWLTALDIISRPRQEQSCWSQQPQLMGAASGHTSGTASTQDSPVPAGGLAGQLTALRPSCCRQIWVYWVFGETPNSSEVSVQITAVRRCPIRGFCHVAQTQSYTNKSTKQAERGWRLAGRHAPAPRVWETEERSEPELRGTL